MKSTCLLIPTKLFFSYYRNHLDSMPAVTDPKRSNVIKFVCFLCSKKCSKDCPNNGCNPCPQHIIKWRKLNIDKAKTAGGTVKHLKLIHSKSPFSRLFDSQKKLKKYPDAFKFNSSTKCFVGGKFDYTLWNISHPREKIVDIPCWCHAKPSSSQQKLMYQIGGDLPLIETHNNAVTDKLAGECVPSAQSSSVDAGESSMPTAEHFVDETVDCAPIDQPQTQTELNSTVIQKETTGENSEADVTTPEFLFEESSENKSTGCLDSKLEETEQVPFDQVQSSIEMPFDSSELKNISDTKASEPYEQESCSDSMPDLKTVSAELNKLEKRDPATIEEGHEQSEGLSKSLKRRAEDEAVTDYV